MYLQFLILYREKVIDFFIINFHVGNSNQKLAIRYLKTLPPKKKGKNQKAILITKSYNIHKGSYFLPSEFLQIHP